MHNETNLKKTNTTSLFKIRWTFVVSNATLLEEIHPGDLMHSIELV